MNQSEIKKICPVTGLEIIESTRWKNLKLSENYVISFRKIGEHVVDVHGHGHVHDFDAIRYHNFLDKFVEDQHIVMPFVEMRNYEDLDGLMPTRQTMLNQKNYFIENKDRRIGFVAYNASNTIAMIMMSGQRQYKRINMILKAENSYNDAIVSALKILDDYLPHKPFKISKKTYRIKSDEIDKVALYSGRFLWEENDSFDLENSEFDPKNPLYPIIENLAIVREELLDLERDVETKTDALEMEKQQTEKIVESLQSGIFIIDPIKDRITDANPAACKLLSSDKEHLIGKKFSDFLVDDYQDLLEGSKECKIRTVEGEVIPVLRSKVKVILNQKEYFLENYVDISVAKEQEEKLKKSLAHTKQLNKLTFNREKRIIEMKSEVNELLFELGREAKYKSVISRNKDAKHVEE